MSSALAFLDRFSKGFCKLCLLLSLIFINACNDVDGLESTDNKSNSALDSTAHPLLLLNQKDILDLRSNYKSSSTYLNSVKQAQSKVDAYFATAPDVPVPADGGGGYTHEQHKANAKMLYSAGALYQILDDEKYAKYVRDMFFRYAELYPNLDYHPKKKELTPGKLFWQSLNEAWWLVYSIQAYDAIYDSLSEDDKNNIENNLFIKMADYLSAGQPDTFNKIHNHGTWAVAAVGMTGYVLDKMDYVEKALYGLDKSGQGGFLKQIDNLFSPEGYYSEGPYYHRYALMPFIVFAKAIDQNQPELNIFSYRESVLNKAVYTLIQLSYANYFFPLNDAIKDKGLDTDELTFALAIAYGLSKDSSLLSIASLHDSVILTGDGYHLAKAIDDGLASDFPYKSIKLGDGINGNEGALAILRSGPEKDAQALVFKATKQGMGHGHFDKLHWQYYDNSHEIISDYGAARFLNVVEKNGGHYLPENKSWAKQTIAHNTLVVDETSHFDFKLDEAKEKYPEFTYFESADNLEIASAVMHDAYPDTTFERTLALIRNENFSEPLILDVVKASSDSKKQYDLPIHYKGHLTNFSHELESNASSLQPLGNKNGYQHLWLKAEAKLSDGMHQVTWLKGNKFYSYSSAIDSSMQALFTETGANDPNFNLRHETALILRAPNTDKHTFVNILESHGEYNGSKEFTKDSSSNIADIDVHSQRNYDLIKISTKDGKKIIILLSYDTDKDKSHKIIYNDREYSWTGFYSIL